MKTTQVELLQLLLTSEEACALHKLLGLHSCLSQAQLGMTPREARLTAEIWSELDNQLEE